MIVVDTSEVVALAARLATAAAGIVDEAKTATKTAGDEMLAAMRRDAPVLTGALRASIDGHSAGGDYVAGTDVDYGFYQEFGTSRHSPQPWAFHNGDRAGVRLADGLEAVADPLRG
jgi:hypothetical protein